MMVMLEDLLDLVTMHLLMVDMVVTGLQGDCHQDHGALTVVQVNPKHMKLCDRQRWPNLWSLRAKWRHWLKVKEKEKKRTHRWKKTNLWNLDLLTLNTMHLLLLEFPFSKMPWLES
jgi:hypothetical protein